jgi:hypothetical protein
MRLQLLEHMGEDADGRQILVYLNVLVWRVIEA